MPRKIRQPKRELRKAGFIFRPGKGDHTVWKHPRLPYAVTISGNDGNDAQSYRDCTFRENVYVMPPG